MECLSCFWVLIRFLQSGQERAAPVSEDEVEDDVEVEAEVLGVAMIRIQVSNNNPRKKHTQSLDDEEIQHRRTMSNTSPVIRAGKASNEESWETRVTSSSINCELKWLPVRSLT